MAREVFINKLSKFLPNNPVSNEDMEEYLGFVNGRKSRSKNIVLRSNGIKTRYYAIDKNGNSTHSNAEMTALAIKKLFDSTFSEKDIELLVCGTSSPDQLMPGHASMIQGLIGGKPYEAMSPSGSCNTGMQALKYAYLSILAGEVDNSIVTGSEKTSTWMLSKNFDDESKKLEELGNNPYIAFEKDFLRWMLSDGAAAALVTNKPNNTGLSLRIDWIDISSFANEYETCMYAGAIKKEDGSVIPWRDLSAKERTNKSVFALKQDTKVLEQCITRLGGLSLVKSLEKHNFSIADIDFFLPHMSSEFFRQKIADDAAALGHEIPADKWFTNLTSLGNVGSASAFLMLEELLNNNMLKKEQKILLMVPESARFSYTYSLITVV